MRASAAAAARSLLAAASPALRCCAAAAAAAVLSAGVIARAPVRTFATLQQWTQSPGVSHTARAPQLPLVMDPAH